MGMWHKFVNLYIYEWFINYWFEQKYYYMRKVILFMHMSLDGFICGPNNEQDWMTMTDDAMGKYLAADLLATVDTMLVGRKLYQGFASFWPTMIDNPNIPKELSDFAKWMQDTPKIVFSTTLNKVEWKNSTLATKDIAATIAELKTQPGGDIVTFGGAALAAELTSLNLIDEYRLKLEPVVLGKGKPLFKEISGRVKLKLIKSKAFDSGVVGLYYETIR
jgi:dihydrofolate reductase